MLDPYLAQVHLLLSTLPEIARETAFALKGGTAINLFYRNLPRLSVDLDLTWMPITDRRSSLQNIRRRARTHRGGHRGTPSAANNETPRVIGAGYDL